MSTQDPTNKLKLPNGSLAKNVDNIMLQRVWADELSKKYKIIIAGMGHPTFMVADNLCWESISLYRAIKEVINEASKIIPEKSSERKGKEEEIKTSKEKQGKIDMSSQKGSEISEETEKNEEIVEFMIRPSHNKMATSLNAYYALENLDTQIQPKHILYLAGAAGGLHTIFKLINKDPNNYILTQSPFHTLYIGHHNENKLIPINVMDEQNQTLTIEAIKKAFQEADNELAKKAGRIEAFLLCNPNNPMGTVMNVADWDNIIDFFLERVDCKVIVDEAYDELRDKKSPALLTVLDMRIKKIKLKIAEEIEKQKHIEIEKQKHIEKEKDISLKQPSDFPLTIEVKDTAEIVFTNPSITNLIFTFEKLRNFKKRCIIIRSGTKGMSASGERYCAVIVFDPETRKELEKIIFLNRNQLPYLSQAAYAQGMQEHAIDRLKSKSYFFSRSLSQYPWKFYKVKTENFIKDLEKIGITPRVPRLPFYINIDFSFLKGHEVKDEAVIEQMVAAGFELTENKLMTDVEIAYFLMFAHGLFITPLSYFGRKPHDTPYLRITTTLDKEALDKIQEKLRKIRLDPNTKTIEPLELTREPKETKGIKEKQDSKSPQDSTYNTPLEYFADAMEKYWKKLHSKSKKAKELLYNFIKDSISKAIPIIDSIILKTFSKLLDELLETKVAAEVKAEKETKSDKLNDFLTLQTSFYNASLEKLSADLRGIYENLSLLENFQHYIYSIIENQRGVLEERYKDLIAQIRMPIKKEMMITSKNLSKKLNVLITNHEPEEAANNLASFKRLMLKLIWERINHDFMVHNDSSFINILRCWAIEGYADPSGLVEKIIKLQASIDYGHPQGDESARDMMARALRSWYKMEIAKESVLFVAASPDKIITNCLKSDRIYQIEEDLLEKGIPEDKKQRAIKEIISHLKSNPSKYLIIDESNLEKNYQEDIPLEKYSIVNDILEQYPEVSNRIVFIRSSGSIFSLEKTFISIIVTSNKDLQAKLLEESISLSGHAPRSLQQAYAFAFYQYTEDLRRASPTIKSSLSNFYKLLLSGVYRECLEKVISPKESVSAGKTPENFLFLPASHASSLPQYRVFEINSPPDTPEGSSPPYSLSFVPSSKTATLLPIQPESPIILRFSKAFPKREIPPAKSSKPKQEQRFI